MPETFEGGEKIQPDVPDTARAAAEPVITARFTDLRDEMHQHELGAEIPFSVAQAAFAAIKDHCMLGRPSISDDELRIAYQTGGLSSIMDVQGFNFNMEAAGRLGKLIARARNTFGTESPAK